MVGMAFKGWTVEAVEFYEGLKADNTKTYWQEHKTVYEQFVKDPMEELLVELADDFGPGRVFRPYRDIRFSKDKTPYKLNCAAHLPGGYISFSADELMVGSGLYMPEPSQLQHFRAAVDAPGENRLLSADDLQPVTASVDRAPGPRHEAVAGDRRVVELAGTRDYRGLTLCRRRRVQCLEGPRRKRQTFGPSAGISQGSGRLRGEVKAPQASRW